MSHEPIHIEDIIGAMSAAQLERDNRPATGSKFWSAAIVDVPLFVTPRAFEVLQHRLSRPPAYEAEDDGSPLKCETTRGTRMRVWFQFPPAR